MTLRDLVDNARPLDQHPATRIGGEVWGAPIPLLEYDLPTFPTHVFPPWLRDFVEATAEATQTPVDLSAMLALSVLATCCQGWTVVRVRPDWSEPTNLFTATAMPPGSRKSPVFRAFTAVLIAAEQNLAAEAREQIAIATSNRDILEQQLAEAKRGAAKAKTNTDALIEQEHVEDLSRRLAAFTIPVMPRLLVDDVTPETLATLLSDQGGRMAALSPEGDIFAIMAGRYSSGAPNLGVFLKAHAGDTLRVDRRSRTEFVDYPALTIGITTQPDVIRGLADRPGFRGQGLLARFLYALPVSMVGRRKTDPESVAEEIRAEYHAGITRILELRTRYLANCANIANSDTESLNRDLTSIYTISLPFECHEMVTAFLGWMEPHLAPDGAFGPLADWAGKLTGALVRIAGLLHIASLPAQYSHNSQNSQEMRSETLAVALELSHYLIAHARASFAEMGSDPAIAHAHRALRWITTKQASIFTKRDMFEGIKGTISKADDLDAILKLLCDHSFIRPVDQEERSGPGRKPSQRYEVNPMTYTQNSQNSQNAIPAFTPQAQQANTVVVNGVHYEPAPPTYDAGGIVERLRIQREVGNE